MQHQPVFIRAKKSGFWLLQTLKSFLSQIRVICYRAGSSEGCLRLMDRSNYFAIRMNTCRFLSLRIERVNLDVISSCFSLFFKFDFYKIRNSDQEKRRFIISSYYQLTTLCSISILLQNPVRRKVLNPLSLFGTRSKNDKISATRGIYVHENRSSSLNSYKLQVL